MAGLAMVGCGAAWSLPMAVVSGLIATTAAMTLRARLSGFALAERLRLLTARYAGCDRSPLTAISARHVSVYEHTRGN